MRIKKSILSVPIYLICLVCCPSFVQAQPVRTYDIVLAGGRVIDPETRLDAVRYVGIIQNRIAEISSGPLKGKEVIDVSGMVVSPGFIDLHVHGRSNREQEYQMHDGVTTALELEWGIEYLSQWYASRNGKALINYGASVCWPFERYRSLDKYKDGQQRLLESSLRGGSKLEDLFNTIGISYADTLSEQEMDRTLANIRASLAEGGIGIGVPIGYLPKTRSGEMYKVFELAGELGVLVFSHVREPSIISIQEVIADAILTRAPLHIVHVNSMAGKDIQLAIDMVHRAGLSGFDITTELYPYTASSTLIQSALFNEGWQDNRGASYGDLQWVETGERLTKETFERYRKTGGVVICHFMKPEWIRTGVASQGVMIASDGMPYAPKAHPRTAGTFSRVLARYVREEKLIDLPTAIEKMTLLPARRLEKIAPSMRFKGRMQVGADADITIFNPNTVQDKATFETGLAFSDGIEYVLVNGFFVVKNGKSMPDVFPGQPVYGRYKH